VKAVSKPFTKAFFGALTLFFLASCATPPEPKADLAQEYYNLGNAWFELKKFDQAAVAYQRALLWNPRLNLAALNFARTKAELGDPQGALEVLKPAAAKDPDNVVIQQYVAWLTAKTQGLAASSSLYAALALKLPGDGPTLYNAALSVNAAGDSKKALEYLKRWKEVDGKSVQGLTLLARLYDEENSPAAAAAWFDAAQALPAGDAGRFSPLMARAEDLVKAKQYGDALSAWDDLLALPEAPDQSRGEALFRRGSLLLIHIQDYPKGLQSLLDAWKAGYKDADQWNTLRHSPDLLYSVKLEADLALAGVSP